MAWKGCVTSFPISTRRRRAKKKAPPRRGLLTAEAVARQLLAVAECRQVGRRRPSSWPWQPVVPSPGHVVGVAAVAANPDHVLVGVETRGESSAAFAPAMLSFAFACGPVYVTMIWPPARDGDGADVLARRVAPVTAICAGGGTGVLEPVGNSRSERSTQRWTSSSHPPGSNLPSLASGWCSSDTPGSRSRPRCR